MNGILSLIFILTINSLDKTVIYNIAHYFIDHINDIETKNIRDVSNDSFTSTTSIKKFCQLIGFDSYNEFKTVFLSTLKDRKRQLHRKVKDESLDDLFKKIEQISNSTINKEELLLSIETLVDIMHENKQLYIYGAVFPINICLSFAEDMTIMGVPVHFVQTSYDNGQSLNNDTVNMIISYTGRYIQQRKILYFKIIDNAKKSILISHEREHKNEVDVFIPLPKTKSIDYDDAIFVLLLSMIKYRYYYKYYQK